MVELFHSWRTSEDEEGLQVIFSFLKVEENFGNIKEEDIRKNVF